MRSDFSSSGAGHRARGGRDRIPVRVDWIAGSVNELAEFSTGRGDAQVVHSANRYGLIADDACFTPVMFA